MGNIKELGQTLKNNSKEMSNISYSFCCLKMRFKVYQYPSYFIIISTTSSSSSFGCLAAVFVIAEEICPYFFN